MTVLFIALLTVFACHICLHCDHTCRIFSTFLVSLLSTLWCAPTHRQLPHCHISIVDASVEPVSAVHYLEVFIDSDLGAITHVRRSMTHCFAVLRKLLRRYITNDCFLPIVVSLVHSGLNYGNFILAELPVYLQRRLQVVLNAAARIMFRLRRYDDVTNALAILHWLCLPERFNFTGECCTIWH